MASPVVYLGGNPARETGLRCAWVVLVMIGRAYVPGALVVAQSLRALKTRHDLVCMVTPDVPEDAVAQLRLVYTAVEVVPYIEHRAREFASSRQRELYGGWLTRAFTKWNCLGLTDYDRVVLVDADMAFIVNVDDLFELPPPAACFCLPSLQPWKPKGIANPYLALPGADAGGGDTANVMPHGMRIPAAAVAAALRERTVVGGGFLVLLAPAEGALEAYVASLGPADAVYGAEFRTLSGIDEASIAAFLAGDWTHIHQRYAAIPWHPEWVARDIRGLHYIGRKPWDMAPEEYPDLADWWRFAAALVKAHLSLRGLFYHDGPATPLDAAAAELRLTADLRNMLVQAARALAPRADARAEIDGVLERWLLAMAQGPRPAAPPVGGWARVYRQTGVDDAFNNKLVAELAKCQPRLVRSMADAAKLAVEMLGVVNRRLTQAPRPSGGRAVCDGAISYGGHFRAAATPRTRQLVAAAGCEATALAAMRYATVVSAGQQWGVPQAYADELYGAFGVRGEAFASPFNARLLGKPGAVFCSLFADTDAPFGSVGDFFDQSPAEIAARSWIVNPPFVESIMADAAGRFEQALADAGGSRCTVFFVLPDWADSAAHRALAASKWLAARIALVPGEYFFEDAAGAQKRTRARTAYFALESPAAGPTRRAELEAVMKRWPKPAAAAHGGEEGEDDEHDGEDDPGQLGEA